MSSSISWWMLMVVNINVGWWWWLYRWPTFGISLSCQYVLFSSHETWECHLLVLILHHLQICAHHMDVATNQIAMFGLGFSPCKALLLYLQSRSESTSVHARVQAILSLFSVPWMKHQKSVLPISCFEEHVLFCRVFPKRSLGPWLSPGYVIHV